MENDAPEWSFKVPNNISDEFGLWLLDNNYAYRTAKEYVTYCDKLIGDKTRLKLSHFDAFLFRKSSLPKSAAVKALIFYLRKQYNIVVPEIDYPRSKKVSKLPVAFDPKEILSLLPKLQPSCGLMLALQYYGALRVSEVIFCKVENFDWDSYFDTDERLISLKLENTKYNTERRVLIPRFIMDKVRIYADKHRDGEALKKGLLFSFNRVPFTIGRYKYVLRKKKLGWSEELIDSRWFKKVHMFYSRDLKLVFPKAILTHNIRSSRATDLDNQGLSPITIRDYLGHKSIATTNRYLVANEAKLKKAFENID